MAWRVSLLVGSSIYIYRPPLTLTLTVIRTDPYTNFHPRIYLNEPFNLTLTLFLNLEGCHFHGMACFLVRGVDHVDVSPAPDAKPNLNLN